MTSGPHSLLRRIHKLLEQKKFRKALPLAEELRGEHPDQPFHWAALVVALLGCRKHAKALVEIRDAIQRFPDDPQLQYYLAETFTALNRWEEAEQAYGSALRMTPNVDRRGRSECLNGMGVVYWNLRRRDDALEAWKKAAVEDPTNRAARKNLEDFTNAYGEPTPPSEVFDDPYHFREIQFRRYFEQQGRTEFNSEAEAVQVIGAIFEAWNRIIVPRVRELDRMTPAEKSQWFESVEVDFLKPVEQPPLPRKRPKAPNKSRRVDHEIVRLTDGMWTHFGFLPSGRAAMLVMTVGEPALSAVGVNNELMVQIMDGRKATDDEKERISWAWEVVNAIVRAKAFEGERNEIEGLRSALTIAKEKLGAKAASTMIGAVRRLINALGDDVDPET